MSTAADKPKIDPKDYVVWMRFEDNAASLRRAIAPSGQKAILLIVRDKTRLDWFREKAAECGMAQVGEKALFRAIIGESGHPPVNIRDMARIFGATAFPLKKADLVGPNYTINLAPKQEAKAEAGPAQPDPATLEVIGLNQYGSSVLRGPDGKRYRRITRDQGETYLAEYDDRGDFSTFYLLARTPQDLDAIGRGLLEMAGKGTLHVEDFDRVVAAALEGWDAERAKLGEAGARRRIALSMMRQIGEEAIEDRGSVEKFNQAMRLANATSFVLSRELSGEEEFAPSPMMVAFLRRMVRDGQTVDFRGGEVLGTSMPRSRNENSAHQVHDLTATPEGSVQEMVANILARRPETGHTLIVLRGEAGSEHIDRLRHEIGLQYAFEGVAEVTSAVATGIQDQGPATLVLIGARRPEPLEALPQAAMRTFNVLTSDDLKTLEREALRSRLRIRDFNRGVREEAAQREADTREENVRQRPYQPLSRVSEPFTMVPIALEGATTMALDRVRRDFDDRGGVDATVAFGLGLSLDELPNHLTAEQVDAIALRMHAAERQRGFIVADQTGIGKGRTLAAIAAQELRQNGKRVLYFTESAAINVRDVTRDLLGVGVKIVDVKSRAAQEGETKVAFLTAGSVFEFERTDQATGLPMPDSITSLPAKARSKAMTEGVWPEGADITITTYTQFNFREEDAKAAFLDIFDENTVVVMDEAHNALNPRSNVGRNLRKIIERVGPQNVVYGTATYARSSFGLDLYRPALPASIGEDFFESLQAGGEIALESFSTMLAQDGVLVRRDHDLSSIEFFVSIPDDEMMARYQAIMDRFSPVVEMMIDASTAVGEHLGRASAIQFREAMQRGMTRQDARALSNEMNQYSIGIGAPLSMIARLAMNAIRIDQLVDVTIEEIQEGRKPLITFHSTSEALLKEFCRDEDGKVSDELMAGSQNLTFRDQVHRIHESVYKVKVDGEREDARILYPDVMESFERVRDAINALPEDLPVSPIDALMERLEAHGYAVGEISGRTLCYRDGMIQRRQGRDRTQTIDGFNDGTLDVLIYNGAGATGGSYHAAPNVRDQRPRTMLEFEPPLDPIKYIQGLGRGNRYGQVARPRVKSVVTGLTPEMRIMQQRNNKLRMLGASVDGNRSHPMLLDDVPDLLNKVGDEATRNVLLSMPSMARRLGFPEFAEENRDADQAAANDGADEGVGDTKAVDSLANKVLSRSLSLSAKDQNELVQRIVVEFEALIEELDSRNANPLRPKQLTGEIDIRDRALFKGEERDSDDLDTSAFTSPLYMQTGIHRFNEAAWTGEKLISEIEASQRLYGADGFQPWAERLAQGLPMLLRSYLPEGMRMEDALADPVAAGRRFQQRHTKLTDLQWLLENIRPGVAVRFPGEWDEHAEITRVIIGVQPPRHASMFDTPAAYRMKTISAGDATPQVTSLSRISKIPTERIIFSPGLSEGLNERFMNAFDQQALLTRQLPVQILTGNILSAIQEARRHNLGTVSLYRDTESRVHRGIVVSRNKVDLSKLPVPVPNADVAVEVARMLLAGRAEANQSMRLYISMDRDRKAERSGEEDGIITIRQGRAVIDFIALRKSNYDFFAERRGLHELIHGDDLPRKSEVRARVARNGQHRPLRLDLTDEVERERLFEIVGLLGEASMLANGDMRSLINEATTMINRVRDGYVREDGPEAERPGAERPDGEDATEVAGEAAGQRRQAPEPYPGDAEVDVANIRFEL